MNTKAFPIILHDTAMAWRNELDKRLKPMGLSQAKWRTLVNLSIAGKPLTQKELANHVGIENSTLVGLLDRLARDGWIIRCDSSSDRRAKMVHLTEKAEMTLIEIFKIADQLCKELLSPISEQELQQCITVLERIKQGAGGGL